MRNEVELETDEAQCFHRCKVALCLMNYTHTLGKINQLVALVL